MISLDKKSMLSQGTKTQKVSLYIVLGMHSTKQN